MRPVTINYARNLWLRDMMIANGDAHKPIWISEMAWNPVPNDPAIADLERYGRVTMEQAAEWAPLAYERAIKDWPWVGVVFAWYFKPANDANRWHSWYYFRLVEPDFTPTPVYNALKDYITGTQPKTLGAGRHGTAHHGVNIANADGSETRIFRFEGTDIALCHGSGAPVRVELDGKARGVMIPAAPGCISLGDGLGAGEHLIRVTADDWTGLDSLLIHDFGVRHRVTWLLVGGVAALLIAVVLGAAVHSRLRRADPAAIGL
jgi:hypothetical protein